MTSMTNQLHFGIRLSKVGTLRWTLRGAENDMSVGSNYHKITLPLTLSVPVSTPVKHFMEPWPQALSHSRRATFASLEKQMTPFLIKDPPTPKKKTTTPSSNEKSGVKHRFSASPMWKLEGVQVENGTYFTVVACRISRTVGPICAQIAPNEREEEIHIYALRFFIRCLVFEINAIKDEQSWAIWSNYGDKVDLFGKGLRMVKHILQVKMAKGKLAWTYIYTSPCFKQLLRISCSIQFLLTFWLILDNYWGAFLWTTL